jgi:hypothetical protein
VEPETQSGDDPEQMDRENQDTTAQGQGEFEVKEQDRWLPIANGLFCSACSCILPRPPDLRVPFAFCYLQATVAFLLHLVLLLVPRYF